MKSLKPGALPQREWQLEVLLSELSSKEEFFQSQMRNEASNFLAVLGSISAAVTIYLSQMLSAQGNHAVPGAVILGLAIAFLWFPMNQAWHMAELRMAEEYVDSVLSPETRKIVGARSDSQILTWRTFRLKSMRPRWGNWYSWLPMTARGLLLYIPSVSLIAYSIWGLDGDGIFDINNVLQLVLLIAALFGLLSSFAALCLPYFGDKSPYTVEQSPQI